VRRGLSGADRGASAVEFALVAPLFFVFLFLLIEGARVQWTQQIVQEVAGNTARCMAIGTTACADGAAITAYARARGRSWGVVMDPATVDSAANQMCHGVTAMNRVTIRLPYRALTGLLPDAPAVVTATACYPAVV